MRMLEEENARLKRLVADLTLGRISCKRCYEKSLKPARRRELAHWILKQARSQCGEACL